MKLPAIRAKIGDWNYYITTLTFEQVAQNVSVVDDELHKSESLKEMIQRSITHNYLSIKNYILNQPELFFNSLVLAVYDDYPDWREIEIKYDDFETYQMGILDFSNQHKIFPVDGQHRVEGIKAALEENPALKNQNIGAIFIGHKNDTHGMRKTRRLFSTLNRYAKPVTMDDIIALDEDDAVAIICRDLLEEHSLFTGRRVTKSRNKAIQDSDKDSFTSIITLYECSLELLKLFRSILKNERPNPARDKKSLKEFQKFRPDEEELKEYKLYCFGFWNEFVSNFQPIQDFLNTTTEKPALNFRNSEMGGNLLFRPVGLSPFVKACIEIHKRSALSFSVIFGKFNTINFSINENPWKQVLWSTYNKTMIMGNQQLTTMLLIYLFDKEILEAKEIEGLRVKYADASNFQGEIEKVLDLL